MNSSRFNVIITLVVAVLLIAAVTCAIIALSVLAVFTGALIQAAIMVLIIGGVVLLWAKLKSLLRNLQDLLK